MDDDTPKYSARGRAAILNDNQEVAPKTVEDLIPTAKPSREEAIMIDESGSEEVVAVIEKEANEIAEVNKKEEKASLEDIMASPTVEVTSGVREPIGIDEANNKGINLTNVFSGDAVVATDDIIEEQQKPLAPREINPYTNEGNVGSRFEEVFNREVDQSLKADESEFRTLPNLTPPPKKKTPVKKGIPDGVFILGAFVILITLFIIFLPQISSFVDSIIGLFD